MSTGIIVGAIKPVATKVAKRTFNYVLLGATVAGAARCIKNIPGLIANSI